MKNIFITFLVMSLTFCAPTKKVYNVEGMMCGVGCVKNISSTLKTVEGIHEFTVDFENKRMEVVFDDEPAVVDKASFVDCKEHVEVDVDLPGSDQ